ncbi:non-hydrolyzing UDP-N-acetylglucosamine 2-epimerase [Luteococcus sp. Sow4_B9]|uniref:non-hydrolyzing UDP-N-acetylglucosamine 2-epimerase n=1 Tax=Luteococcus sp. Sow4_B9 TaxID=3438792 RepID=UPI003F9DDFD6
MKHRVLVIYGTRPEAVKVAPLVRAMQSSSELECVTAVTGQHREMLDQVNEVFGIVPDHDLALFEAGQSLNKLSSKVFAAMDALITEVQPSAIVVQGDTTTVAVAAIAGFNRQIPVVHLEAGLRSGDIDSPFPEEANRKLAGQVAKLHLSPTPEARANLLAEGVNPDSVVVTGNTVIDAMLETAEMSNTFDDERLTAAVEAGRRIIALTVHRRENLGAPMASIAAAVGQIASLYPEATIVFPMHRNPAVREAMLPVLNEHENVITIEPLDYVQFIHLQKNAHLVLTDSGGVQEEAPSMGKPVLVLRNNTERPEAVTAGTVRLIGTDTERIVNEVARLMDNPIAYEEMAHAVNPYGDGLAARRAVAAIEQLLGVGTRVADFEPLLPGQIIEFDAVNVSAQVMAAVS